MNSLLRRAPERLGCSKEDSFESNVLLSHKFLTDDFGNSKPRLPLKIKMQSNTSYSRFAYGPPKLGMELLKDFATWFNWYLIPEKLVVFIKSNRKLYIMSEDEQETKVHTVCKSESDQFGRLSEIEDSWTYDSKNGA